MIRDVLLKTTFLFSKTMATTVTENVNKSKEPVARVTRSTLKRKLAISPEILTEKKIQNSAESLKSSRKEPKTTKIQSISNQLKEELEVTNQRSKDMKKVDRKVEVKLEESSSISDKIHEKSSALDSKALKTTKKKKDSKPFNTPTKKTKSDIKLKNVTHEDDTDDRECKHFEKKDKSLKTRKGTSKLTSTVIKSSDSVAKPELAIPEIIIPVNKPQILKKAGPSSWNGTVKYDNKVFLGAHISAAGGLENAITNSIKIGGSSFALFLKNQRQWVSKPMEDSTVERFKAACTLHNFPAHLIIPHGSYLMNCGSSDPVILAKSRATLLDEIQRCERLGILYFNIHPGSSCGKGSREETMQLIADSINWVHDQTPNSKVAVVLENMCRQGNTIGGDFSELAWIINKVFDQSRVGVCLDTCHALAAGYDLATPEGFDVFLEEFERIIGFRYLVAVHLNDSEGALGCHRDRHASIGKGHIGLEGFRRIINCPRFRDIPVVLETPFISDDYYKQEILLLKSLAESDTICA